MTETTATPAASNSTQPTNAANGATASTNTTPVSPTNLKYPVVQADGKEYSSIETLLDDLANETEGAYLLGTNFCWHGGIHISSKNEKFAHHKDQKMVRCMMDGTVVAYRLNKEYCTESWKPTDTSEEKSLQYSTGFCLVKHDYVSPANNEEGENKGKTNSLTFYSLYIHLADFSAYHLNEDQTTTAGTQYILEKNRNVRSSDDIQTVLGVLGKDSVVEVAVGDGVERHLINQYHREYDFYKAKIISIAAHGSDSTLSVGSTIYITKENLKTKSEAPKTLLFPAYWKGTVTAQTDRSNMWIYASEDECKTHHQTTSILKKGMQEVTFTLDKIKLASNNIMAECTLPNTPEYTPRSTVWPSNKAWMYVTQGSQLTWTKFTPDESNYDKVILCNIPIKAGDPIGFMGAWDNPILDSPTGAIETSHMMHIELFSEADKATLEKLLNNEAKLKSGRQYLKIPQGLKPLIEDGGRLVPCNTHNTDPSFGTTKEICIELDGSINKKESKEGKEYYCLTGLEVENATLQCKCYIDITTSSLKILSQYDLKDIGYQILDEANQSTNGYVTPENITSQLYKGIFDQVDVDHSHGLSASEIHDAFRNKSLRRQINQIIAGHPSEWHQETQVQIKSLYDDKIGKTNNEINKKLMTLEKKRIESCEFFSQVPLEKKIWHFSSFNIISSLENLGVSLEKAQEISLFVSNLFEGKPTKNGDLDYGALAGDFDGQGMSFGIIQWNFGTDTLGQILLSMYQANNTKFKDSFDDKLDVTTLISNVEAEDHDALMHWARKVQKDYNLEWKSAFLNLSKVEEFNDIQKKSAIAKYHGSVLGCISFMRSISPELMSKIEVRTYVALFDLCVQQGSLTPKKRHEIVSEAATNIKRQFEAEQPSTQIEFLKIACRERAYLAKSASVLDCLSRRFGIINGFPYKAEDNGQSRTRPNANFNKIVDGYINEI